MRLLVAVVALVCQPALAEEPLSQSSSASASAEDAAREQIALGLSKYEAGDYRPAAELFLAAYKIVPDANLLYNAARCFERLGENRKAIVRYQQFIESPDSEQGGKARANAALQRLEQAEFLALRKGPSDHSDHVRPRESVSTGAPDCGCQSGVPWYLLGVGTAAAGAGAWSLITGLERRRQVTEDPAFEDSSSVHELTHGQASSLLESSQRRITWGTVGLGAGGALLTTAIVWWLLDESPSPRRERPSVSIQPTESGSGLLLGGRF